MSSTDFQLLAASDPHLREFLNQTVRESGLPTEPKTFATGLEPLAIWACYALFRWSKMVLDARQRQLELDTARQQAQLICELVDEGWPREQAEVLVPALLNGLNARQKDDTFQNALQKALASAGQSEL
jgi:hypothetical protein